MSHTAPASPEITIRAAHEGDTAGIARVTGRDAATLPAEPILVAEVSGEIRAAISLANGGVVADPFHRTVELVEMLRIRARAASADLDAHRGHVLTFRRRRRARLAFRSAA